MLVKKKKNCGYEVLEFWYQEEHLLTRQENGIEISVTAAKCDYKLKTT